MDKQRRKELQEQYKEIKTYMGVVQVKNLVNGKLFIASYPNLKNKWLSMQGQLDLGLFPCAELVKEWKQYGKEAFAYEVLEEKSTEDVADKALELRNMEKVWMGLLQPYDDKGYNRRKD